jgi:hypothetical protein
MIVVNPPDWAKPTTDSEATGKRSCRAIRGDWEQRTSKAKSETWEIPNDGLVGGKRPRPTDNGKA